MTQVSREDSTESVWLKKYVSITTMGNQSRDDLKVELHFR